jgi:hypothetical protein
VERLEGVDAVSAGLISSNSLSVPLAFQDGFNAEGVVSLGDSALEGDKISEGGVLSFERLVEERLAAPINAELLKSDIVWREGLLKPFEKVNVKDEHTRSRLCK